MKKTDEDPRQKEIDLELYFYSNQPSSNEIIDNIFIGNYAFALNKKLLQEYKITHILNCASDLRNFFEEDGCFKYLYIPLYDSPSTKIEKYLDHTNKFIEEGSSNGNKILIHCAAGMSRSATITMMYLIMKKGMTFSKAKEAVKKKGLLFVQMKDL